jgi:amidase
VVTRTVRDTVAFYQALEARRPWAGDRTTANGGRARGPLRMGLFDDAPGGTAVDAEVRAAVNAAGRLCESLGHRVEAIACPFEGSVVDDFLAYWGFVAWIQKRTARVMLDWSFDPARLEPWTRELARSFTSRRLATFSAIRRLRRFAGTYARVLSAYDVLIGPTCAEPAPRLGTLATDLPFGTLLERLRTYCAFTPIQNVSGAPAVSLPLGRSAAGLPIGVHFAAARGDDTTLLELAAAIERERPWEHAALGLANMRG